MEIIDQYLEEVCGCVANSAYRRAVRRELKNHLDDSMEMFEQNGSDRTEAAKHAIAEMGDAREMGSRMNRHFAVHPNIRILAYIFAILFLYIVTGIKIHFSLFDILLTLAVYLASVCLLFFLNKIDLEGKSRSVKYVYFGTLLLLLAACIFSDMRFSKECMAIGGGILFLCISFFVYRLSRSGTLGLAIALCLFVLPVPLFLLSAAYAALFLYMATGIYTFVCFVIRGWQLKYSVKVILPLLMFIMLGGILLFCKTSIFTKRNLWRFFFLSDGTNHFSYLDENFRVYPLAACINHFGFWALAVYIILLSLVLVELIRMKRKIRSIWGRNVLNCIIFTFLVKGTMAVLLNLGIPLVGSYMLPFTGLGGDQISNLFLIVLAEYVYCFGNIIFTDYSFFEGNRLFRIENGAITFYFREKV